jgi:hypothetical protein
LERFCCFYKEGICDAGRREGGKGRGMGGKGEGGWRGVLWEELCQVGWATLLGSILSLKFLCEPHTYCDVCVDVCFQQ